MRLSAILTCGLILLSITRVNGSAMMYGSFDDQAKAAEFIVEGTVESQVEINKDIPLGSAMVYMRQSAFAVSKLYKGDTRVGDKLSVLSHQTFICDTSRLEQGRSYILFLKKGKDGLVDIASGQGTYEIIDLGPGEQVVVNRQTNTAGGERIEQFRSQIAWVVRGPTSQPVQATLSAEEAVKIARQALAEAGVDLKEFELTKTELIQAYQAYPEVAHRGDPMWSVRWTIPEARRQSADPRQYRAGAYVHAGSGKVQLDHWIAGRNAPSVEEVCRVFLAIRGLYQPAGEGQESRISTRELSEEEFRKDAPRLSDIFLHVRPDYPARTRFVRVELSNGRTLILVLEPPRRVVYAGIVPASPATSRSAN